MKWQEIYLKKKIKGGGVAEIVKLFMSLLWVEMTVNHLYKKDQRWCNKTDRSNQITNEMKYDIKV